jgi:hypothetical protein
MNTTDERLIPCNERMPEHNERYDDRTRKHYLILDEYGDFHVAYYTSIGWIPTDGFHITDDEVEVIAWMPLPEKYKAESEERNDK